MLCPQARVFGPLIALQLVAVATWGCANTSEDPSADPLDAASTTSGEGGDPPPVGDTETAASAESGSTATSDTTTNDTGMTDADCSMVVEDLTSSQAEVVRLVRVRNTLYWTDREGSVFAFDEGSNLTELDSSLLDPGLAADDLGLAWTDRDEDDGFVSVVDLDNDPFEPLLELEDQVLPTQVALDPLFAYWFDSPPLQPSRLFRVLREDDEVAEDISPANANLPADTLVDLVVDDEFVYVLDTFFTTSSVLRLSKIGGNGLVLALGISGTGRRLALDDDNVYIATSDGIYRQSKSVPDDTRPVVDGVAPGDLAVDGGTIYFTDPARSTLRSVPTEGGAVTDILDGRSDLTAIAVDELRIYWSDRRGSDAGSIHSICR